MEIGLSWWEWAGCRDGKILWGWGGIELISATIVVIDVKTVFFTFFIHGTFLTFFILPTFFIFKNVHWKYHRKSLSKQRKQIGSVWLFFFVPMLEFPYRPIYWQALLLTYSICTPLCKILNTPVMSICLVKQNDGTWVEKHQRFLFNVYKRFF